MRLFDRLIERRVAAWQNDLLAKHFSEVENTYRQMRAWRHDFHNHIQALLALAGNEQKTREYLLGLNEDLTRVDTVVKTGNVMADAILNSKLSLIQSQGICVNARAAAPQTLRVSDIDLCAILGNLLDNALEACLRQGEGEARFIRVYMGVFQQQLYISVTNSTAGAARRSGKEYPSAKNRPGHGFGLMRVDRLAAKYGGYVNRQSEEGAFATEVLLPL